MTQSTRNIQKGEIYHSREPVQLGASQLPMWYSSVPGLTIAGITVYPLGAYAVSQDLSLRSEFKDTKMKFELSGNCL